MIPLKILQVSYDLNIGGLQRVVVDLARELRKLSQDVHVASLRGEGPLMGELRDLGVTVHALPHDRNKVDRLKPWRMFKLLRREMYHVIHTHNTQPFIEAGVAALAARTPVRVHTDHNRVFPDLRRYILAERAVSMGYDRVVGVSRYTADNLRRYVGIAAKRLTVVPNGIEPEKYLQAMTPETRAEGRRAHGLDGFTTVFGLGARLEPVKGLHHWLDAFPAVLARHGGAGVALCGPGSAIPDLKAQAERLGIADRVKFIPPMPDLARFYPLVDMVVLPSLSEGMPLCLLEAMCLGLPILASRVGGVPELVRDGENGVLVDPGDVAGLARGACALLDRPDWARDLAQRGREEFHSKYRADVMAEAYLALYRVSYGKKHGRA